MEHETSKQGQSGSSHPVTKRAKTGSGAAAAAPGFDGYAAPSASATLASRPPSSAAAGPASSAPFAAAAANGASRVLELELAAGLQSQLRQIATRFGVSWAMVLREFVRFLEIKQWAKDSDHTKISPTPLMDAVWHAALLETKLYDRIEAHVGMRLHHSTAAAAEDGTTSAAREERLTALRQLYQLRYNDRPVELE
jgi:hypothetical protein